MTTGSNPDHPTPLPTARGQTGRSAGLAVALAMSMPAVALAQSPADPPVTGQAAPAKPGFMTDFWTRDTLFGSIGGLRDRLGEYGITIGLQEVSEVLGNVTGGVHTGFAYDGVTIMNLGLDTEKAFGLPGGTFRISALQIHGRNLAADNLLNLQIPSGIEADRTTRLWEFGTSRPLWTAGSASGSASRPSTRSSRPARAPASSSIRQWAGRSCRL